MQVSPSILISSLVSQTIVTWAYKHPDIKWVNKKTVKLISAVLASFSAVASAYAAGTLDQDLVQNLLNAIMDAVLGSGLAVGFYEWSKEPKD
jgi:hypothetical protein